MGRKIIQCFGPCGLEREAHWFRWRQKRDGTIVYEKLCRECSSKRSNGRHRDRRYLMAKSFEEMVADQNGLCLICKQPPQSKGLNVDHDHITGLVRGLLCTKCNTGLGAFNDDPVLLRAALEYMEAL